MKKREEMEKGLWQSLKAPSSLSRDSKKENSLLQLSEPKLNVEGKEKIEKTHKRPVDSFRGIISLDSSVGKKRVLNKQCKKKR